MQVPLYKSFRGIGKQQFCLLRVGWVEDFIIVSLWCWGGGIIIVKLNC